MSLINIEKKDSSKYIQEWNRSMIHGIEWLLAVNAGSFKKDYLFWKEIEEEDLSILEKMDLELLQKEFETTYDLYGYKYRLLLISILNKYHGFYYWGPDPNPWYHLVGKREISAIHDLNDAMGMIKYWQKEDFKIPPVYGKFHSFCDYFNCILSKNCMFLFSQDILGLLSIPFIYPNSPATKPILKLNKTIRDIICDILDSNYSQEDNCIGWSLKIINPDTSADPNISSYILNYLSLTQSLNDKFSEWTRNEEIIEKVINFIRLRFDQRKRELNGASIANTNSLIDGLWKSKFAGPSGYEVDSSFSETIEIAQNLFSCLINSPHLSREKRQSIEDMLNHVMRYLIQKLDEMNFLTYCFERDRYFELSPISDIKGIIQFIDFYWDLQSHFNMSTSRRTIFKKEVIKDISLKVIELITYLCRQQGIGGWWPILSEDNISNPLVKDNITQGCYKINSNPHLNNISFDNTLYAIRVLCKSIGNLSITINGEKLVCPNCEKKSDTKTKFCGYCGTKL